LAKGAYFKNERSYALLWSEKWFQQMKQPVTDGGIYYPGF